MGVGTSAFALTGDDYVIVATDRIVSNYVILKDDEHKIYKINDRVAVATTGSPEDSEQFSQFVSKNMSLYRLRHGFEPSTSAVAHFTRHTLAEGLRSSSPYSVNLLLCGYDSVAGPELYFLDKLAAMHKMAHATMGCGGKYTMSVMDKYHQPSLTRGQAYELMQMCVREVHKRCIFNLHSFGVNIIDKSGIHELPAITATSLGFCDKRADTVYFS